MAAPDDPAENDEDVVEQRPKCGEKKEPMREKHGGDNASDVKEDLGGKKDARETRAERELLSREAVEHPARDLRCKNFGNDHAGDEHRCHYSNDDRESLLRFSFALLREEAGVDRDKSNGGRASSDDVIQPVRKRESGNVSIHLSAGAELVGDVRLADESDDAREHDRRHQKHGRRKGAVLVRWAKEARQRHGLNDHCRWKGVVWK